MNVLDLCPRKDEVRFLKWVLTLENLNPKLVGKKLSLKGSSSLETSPNFDLYITTK